MTMKKNPYEVIKHRHITEKARILQELKSNDNYSSIRRYKLPKYVFVVDTRANKQEIRTAVEEIYKDKNIKVVDVNTINVKSKRKRTNSRHPGRSTAFKKAIVTLEEGDDLDKV